MLTKINHIGIAVTSIDDALKLYADVLELEIKGRETIGAQKTKTAILPIGESKIELLESTAADSPIARHIEKFGEGLHHIAFEVTDIESSLKKLSERGVSLIDEKPRKGVANTKVAFLHPRGTGRVLLELVQS